MQILSYVEDHEQVRDQSFFLASKEWLQTQPQIDSGFAQF